MVDWWFGIWMRTHGSCRAQNRNPLRSHQGNLSLYLHLESPSDPSKMVGQNPKWGHGPIFKGSEGDSRLSRFTGAGFQFLETQPAKRMPFLPHENLLDI